jgi:hypothetical protein
LASCESKECEKGYTDVESYDCPYCCVPSACDPVKQPSPDWGIKNGKCLQSCGQASDQKGRCEWQGCREGERSVENYQCNYCCVPSESASKICDKDKGQVEPHWKEVKGRCLPSCGHGGGSSARCREEKCTDKEEDIESWDCTALGKHCCVPKNDPGILDVGCRKPEYNIKTGQKCPLVLQGCTYCTCTGKDEKGKDITGQIGPNQLCCVANGKIVGQQFGTECAKDEKGKGVECPSQIKPGDICPKGCGDCWCVGGPVKCWISEDSKCCVEYLNGRQICQSKPIKDSCGGATGMADCKIDTTSGWIYGDIPCKCSGKECKESYCIGGKVCSGESGFGKITCTCAAGEEGKVSGKFTCVDSYGKQQVYGGNTACNANEVCQGSKTFVKGSEQWPCVPKKGTTQTPTGPGNCAMKDKRCLGKDCCPGEGDCVWENVIFPMCRKCLEKNADCFWGRTAAKCCGNLKCVGTLMLGYTCQ